MSIRSRRRRVAVAAVAAGGAAAAYYVYDRYGSRTQLLLYSLCVSTDSMPVGRWEKLKVARATWEELQERCAELLFCTLITDKQLSANGISPKQKALYSMLQPCLSCRDERDALHFQPPDVMPQPPPANESTPVSAATIQQDADRHLGAHFESVQAISTSTTTPSLLPMLLQSLIRNTDYQPLLDELRCG